jgi:hypothetical protein
MSKAFAIFIWFAIGLASTGTSEAADFVWGRHSGHSGLGNLYMLGQIVPGDYDRFVAAIRERGPAPFMLEPRSAGGNVIEAIKIGRLVRELSVSTQAPTAYMPDPIRPNCKFTDEEDAGRGMQCICASACTLVWFGGVMRTGAEIYIHSIAYEKQTFGGASPADAGRMYRQAMNDVKAYLAEMGIDQKYANMMTETASTDVRKISAQEDGILFSWDPAYREWLFAKCGTPTQAMLANGQWGNCTVQVQGEATAKAIKRILN